MTTISKVAERAGVSRTTVSHVLNHADRVSGHLRERVMKAIDELGYVPNPHARSLRTGRTNIVGMLIPDIRNPFYPELVKSVQSELEAVGFDTLIFNTDVPGGHFKEHSQEYLRQVRNKRVDGLIVGDFALHAMHDSLLDIDIPTVFVGELSNDAVDNVKVDDFDGGYQMGAFLARKGHRHVAHLTGPSFFNEAMDRAAGFEKGLIDNGVAPADIMRIEGTFLSPSGVDAVNMLVDHHRDKLPTAIFFANYLMAIGGFAAFHDRGVNIPKDISVAVFGDQPQMEYVRPRLTRVGVQPRVLGQRASVMLIERLNGTYTGAPRREVLKSVLTEMDTA
jgi:DNA-binding LacI/PurR family transcriptional regulator